MANIAHIDGSTQTSKCYTNIIKVLISEFQSLTFLLYFIHLILSLAGFGHCVFINIHVEILQIRMLRFFYNSLSERQVVYHA
jgi:hypothetical protein